jgi:hypothetical protein
MKPIAAVAFAALAAVTTPSVAGQPATPGSDRQPEMSKAYHAGGRHDQRSHEAMLRARASGQVMERMAVHAGGRHDQRAHEVAIRADEKRAAEQDARR